MVTKKKLDSQGFDPRTSRMLSGRATKCTTNPSVIAGKQDRINTLTKRDLSALTACVIKSPKLFTNLDQRQVWIIAVHLVGVRKVGEFPPCLELHLVKKEAS